MTVAAAMSEAEVERAVAGMVKQLALFGYHTRDSRRSAAGFPDWTICGPGGVIFRELKREGKHPTGAQLAWLDALTAAGVDAGVWCPSDLLAGRIARELARLSRPARPARTAARRGQFGGASGVQWTPPGGTAA
jgi:hypothetical protein